MTTCTAVSAILLGFVPSLSDVRQLPHVQCTTARSIFYWIYPSITIIARNLFGSAISTCRSITSLENIKTAIQAMYNLWALKLNLLKGLKFSGHVSSNQCIMAFRRTSTNFLWSDPASIGVIMRKMLGKFCCTPLKMCVQLPLLERDSSFVVVQKTIYSLYLIQEGSWNKLWACPDWRNYWLSYKKLISLQLSFGLLVWYGILYVARRVDFMWLELVWM